MACRRIKWNFLERRLSNLCGRYARYVSRHPTPFIIAPLIVSTILSAGWLYRRHLNDTYYLYTPTSARSLSDSDAIRQKFPLVDGNYVPGRGVLPRRECQLVVKSRDGGSILRDQQVHAVQKLDRYIIDEIRADDSNLTYRNLCMKSSSFCYNNSHVYTIPYLLRNADPYTNVSFPIVTYDSRAYYVGSAMCNVRLDPYSKQMVEAEAWMLLYQLRYQNARDDRMAALWEKEFEKRLLRYDDPDIVITIFTSQTLDKEISRNAETLVPRFAVTFTMLTVFACCCTVRFARKKTRCKSENEGGSGTDSQSSNTNGSEVKDSGKRYYIDWVLSKPGLALIGVVSAGMGVTSAMGLLAFVGLPYVDIVAVMPFLIIAVRLDNTFLMISALDNTKRTLDVQERIVEAMSESAVSITITVLTDVLSFATGVLTDYPVVQIFCIYTATAVIVTFVYQLTLLLACLVLTARAEEEGRHCLLPCVTTVSLDEPGTTSGIQLFFCAGSRVQKRTIRTPDMLPKTLSINGLPFDLTKDCTAHLQQPYEKTNATFMSRFFGETYAPFLVRPATKIAVFMLLFVYLSISAYGCYYLKTGLEPIKVLVDDSYAIPHFRNTERFDQYGQQMQVIVFKPGDLTNIDQRKRLIEIRNRFARMPHSIGDEGVDFFLDAFDGYLRRAEQTSLADLKANEFYSKLDFFLSIGDNLRYQTDLAWRNDSNGTKTHIEAYRFMAGVKNVNYSLNQMDAVDQYRAVANSYAEFGVTVFHPFFLWVDQYEAVLPNVLQEICSGMTCMIGIALFLIPHPICSIWVTAAIASIDFGVVGFMTLWGLNMDVISMLTIIMSIGFSVDFTAHIAYAYVINMKQEPVDRIRAALGSLGWPILQGGIATCIGVIALADLNSYMVVSFFKTVFLVVVFGLLHALVFLPVLLCVLTPKKCFLSCATIDDGEGKPSDKSLPTNVTNEQNGTAKEKVGNEVTPRLKRVLAYFR